MLPNIMFTYPTLFISYVYVYTVLYHLLHLYVIHVSLATLTMPLCLHTHLICIYCT